jgi:N-acetylmuramoyl-L-alanine amidase
VFNLARLLTALLLLLAGCTTTSRRAEPVPDWSQSSGRTPEPPLRPATPFPPPQTAPVPPPAAEATWISLTRWCAERGMMPPARLSTSPITTYGVFTGHGVLAIQIGSPSAWWEDVEVRLGFVPQLTGGQVWLHALDYHKNIEPLLRGFSPVTKPGRVIVLDPGHGGGNPGARSVLNGAWEKDYTLDWAVRLRPLLIAQGWQVILTRTNDVDIPLPARVALAEQRRADLFLSLHFNSSGGGGNGTDQAGLETYCLTPTGMPSTLTRGYPDDASLVLPGNAFDEANVQLAAHLHRAVLRATGQSDRAVRRARFMTVLQGQRCPAVLIEGGYLSNPKEAQRIADWQFRQRLAEALAGALTTRIEDGR